MQRIIAEGTATITTTGTAQKLFPLGTELGASVPKHSSIWVGAKDAGNTAPINIGISTSPQLYLGAADNAGFMIMHDNLFGLYIKGTTGDIIKWTVWY